MVSKLLSTAVEKFNAQQYQEAVTILDKVLAQDPDNSSALLWRGASKAILEQYPAALRDIDHVLRLDSKSIKALRWRVLIYWASERFEECITDADKVIERDPRDTEILNKRADAKRRLQRYQEAIKDFSTVILAEKNDNFALTRRAVCYNMSGNFEDALKDLHRLEACEDHGVFLLCELGNTYCFSEQYAEGLIYFQKAAELYPDNFDVLYRLSSLYLLMKQPFQVVTQIAHFFSNTRKLNVELLMVRAEAYEALGIDVAKSRDLHAAKVECQNQLNANQTAHEFWYQLARCHRALGEYQLALAAIEKALSLDAKNTVYMNEKTLIGTLQEDNDEAADIVVSPKNENNNNNTNTVVDEKTVFSLSSLAETLGQHADNEDTLYKALEEKFKVQETWIQDEFQTKKFISMDELELQKSAIDELGKELSKIKDEISALKKVIGNATTDNAQLSSKLSELEAKEHVVKTDYDESNKMLASKKYILNSPVLRFFYRLMQKQLQQFLLTCKVLNSKMVQRSDFAKSDKVVKYLQLAGNIVPLPAAQQISSVLSYIVQGIASNSKHSTEHMLGQGADVTPSLQEIDDLSEYVARKLSLMYEEQLNMLKPEGITILVEGMIHRVVNWCSEGDKTDGYPGERIINTIAQIRGKEPIWKVTTHLTTRLPGLGWTLEGVLHRPGLIVDEFYYSGQGTRPEKYGYRKGALSEVAGLNKETERKSFTLPQVLPTSATRTTILHLGKVTTDMRAQHTLLAAQLRHEKGTRASMQDELSARIQSVEKMLSQSKGTQAKKK